MKNLLLGIIAINLTINSINMTLQSIEPAHAQAESMRVAICDPNNKFRCAQIKNLALDVNSK